MTDLLIKSGPTLGLSTVVNGLSPHVRALNRQQTALIAEVNQAFDSFQNDYDQARAAALGAGLLTPPGSQTAGLLPAAPTRFPTGAFGDLGAEERRAFKHGTVPHASRMAHL
jgi:hypothetical protein